MSPALTTFLFELANFLLLAAFLGWLLFKPVREVLESRQAAERKRATALDARESAIADERSKLDDARVAFDRDTTRLRKDRIAAAEAEAAALITRARAAADRERDSAARVHLQLERDKIEQLTTSVAAVAREAVARLLKTLASSELDEAFVRAAAGQLESAAARISGSVLVESAMPLDDAARSTLRNAAGSGATSLEFRIVPELGAGLRLTTSHGLIDASAAGIAAHAERTLLAELARSASERTT